MKKCTLPNKVIHDQEQEHKIRYEFATSLIRLLLEDLSMLKSIFISDISFIAKHKRSDAIKGLRIMNTTIVRNLFHIPT